MQVECCVPWTTRYPAPNLVTLHSLASSHQSGSSSSGKSQKRCDQDCAEAGKDQQYTKCGDYKGGGQPLARYPASRVVGKSMSPSPQSHDGVLRWSPPARSSQQGAVLGGCMRIGRGATTARRLPARHHPTTRLPCSFCAASTSAKRSYGVHRIVSEGRGPPLGALRSPWVLMFCMDPLWWGDSRHKCASAIDAIANTTSAPFMPAPLLVLWSRAPLVCIRSSNYAPRASN